MNFEVYCDESGLEALTRKDAHLFTGIGGIWLPSEKRKDLKDSIAAIKAKHNIRGELKWKKVSPVYFELYKDVLDFFFKSDYIRFRIVLIESSKVDNHTFNNRDAELGFYKFYYQLLQHWIFSYNSYDVFLDYKVNRNKGRLKELKKVLENSNLTSEIRLVQGLPSEQSAGIQLADILTGVVVSKFNNEISGEAKKNLIDFVEGRCINKPIEASPKWEEKFNIFKINLRGGW